MTAPVVDRDSIRGLLLHLLAPVPATLRRSGRLPGFEEFLDLKSVGVGTPQ